MRQPALVPVPVSDMNYSHLHTDQVMQPALTQQVAVERSTNMNDEYLSDMPEPRDDTDDDEPHRPTVPNTDFSTALLESRSCQHAHWKHSGLSSHPTLQAVVTDTRNGAGSISSSRFE